MWSKVSMLRLPVEAKMSVSDMTPGHLKARLQGAERVTFGRHTSTEVDVVLGGLTKAVQTIEYRLEPELSLTLSRDSFNLSSVSSVETACATDKNLYLRELSSPRWTPR